MSDVAVCLLDSLRRIDPRVLTHAVDLVEIMVCAGSPLSASVDTVINHMQQFGVAVAADQILAGLQIRLQIHAES